MRQKVKTVLFSLLCVLCLIPTILVASGTFTIQRRGGMSTMGVIIGPIVLPDEDQFLIGGETNTTNEWSSSTGVVKNDPYTDGGLRAYSSLYVVNDKFNSSNGDWKYSSFVKYFKIVRTDGRPIYDDDGVLDVRWWKNGEFTPSDEVVNYAADLYVKTQVLNYNWKGFLGTILNAKFKSGAYFEIGWDRGEDQDDSKTSNVHDKNANNQGSGNYLNNGVNPGPEYYKLTEMDWCDSPYVTVALNATGYWENGWWGGSYDYVDIYSFMSGFMPRANRNWSNSLSVSSSIGKQSYQGTTAYYYPTSYNVTATNLNNLVKIDDVEATPAYGTSVAPYKDGHHILISNSGRTKVSIENGGEGSYTTYYCFVDNTLPDVSYTYHNANALTNRKVGSISTAANGAKTQTIVEGVFKDQVQVNFAYDDSKEAPESATYTYNGKTYNLTSGTWLSKAGDYTVTITDLAGNKTISKFTIDTSAPNYNLDRLQNDTTYKISKWYLTTIPTGYSGSGTYSFATYNEALIMAKNAEFNNLVTTYTLNNVEDFKHTNLLANGETVAVGDYWYYKSKSNPNLYVYYFNPQSLTEVVEYYAKNFVTGPHTYKINATLSPNDYGNKIDDDVIDNLISSGYIVNNFTFRTTDNNEAYKIYYDYQEDGSEKWIEMQYGIPFISQVSSHGLYKIKEVDFVGHETTYLVYLDLNAPMLDIEAKVYGKDKILTQTISVADLPQNGDLVYYYETFKITNVVEDDKWWTMEVKCPDNKIRRYTYLDELPNFEELGSGEFTITIADRLNNTFKFKVYLLGRAPEVKFETINTNTQLKVTISIGESYNSIMDLKIYRNGVCLNSELGYDEYPNDDTNELIYVKPTTLKYLFKKGGIYIIEITDNFGRTLSYDYKFEKELPTGILVGVVHNGKTKDSVQFVYNSDKYFVVVTKDNAIYEAESTVEGKMTTLTFTPVNESEILYSIQLVDKTDTENYNIYTFTIKTIKPTIYLFGVEPDGKTGGNVYATWDNNEEQYSSTVTHNGKTNIYRKGQILSVEGSYTITLQDEIGNASSVNFNIDKTIDFVIADAEGKTYKIEDIKYINFDIRIIESEPLNITITKDDKPMDYDFGLMITEEGYYLVRLNDEYNNSIFFTFTIDKTPPVATLYGVENFGKTNRSAWIVSSESGVTGWYLRDDEYKSVYEIGKEITTHGKYVVYILDQAKNYVSFEFEIDKETNFDINVYRGGISNGGVRIIAYENLKIIMYKGNNPIDYSFEQILKEDGEYSYTITDELGNRTSSFFTIITKKQQNLNHILQEDIEVTSVLKDEENYEFQVLDNNLYLYDEGTYLVNIIDKKTAIEYSFNVTIDTTPPTLELVGVDNGGTTKKLVVMKNVSEKPYTLYITVDGVPFEYKLGEEIEKCGRFKVVLSDEAGNSTTYEFERLYSLNGASIAVLAGLGALVVLIIILIIKSRHKYYRDDIIEEEIEETIVEDDFNDNDDETPKID